MKLVLWSFKIAREKFQKLTKNIPCTTYSKISGIGENQYHSSSVMTRSFEIIRSKIKSRIHLKTFKKRLNSLLLTYEKKISNYLSTTIHQCTLAKECQWQRLAIGSFLRYKYTTVILFFSSIEDWEKKRTRTFIDVPKKVRSRWHDSIESRH